MMTDLQSPLSAPDCDLTNFPFMPLLISRLRRSRSWLMAKRQPELGFYMVNLWTAAWHEVPAGSLEDDDEVLCDFAMCDPQKWDEVKERVLHGWVKCSDGRLYHPVVSSVATESWSEKQSYRNRLAAARAAKAELRKRQKQDSDSSITEPVTEPVTDQSQTNGRSIIGSVTGLKGTGTGTGTKKEEEASSVPVPPARGSSRHEANGHGPPRWADRRIVSGRENGETDPANYDRPLVNGTFLDTAAEKVAEAAMLEVCPEADKTLVQWLADGYEIEQIVEAIHDIAERPDFTPKASLRYFDKPVRDHLPAWKPLQQVSR